MKPFKPLCHYLLHGLLIIGIPTLSTQVYATPSGPLPTGFQVFPANNIWNVPVDSAPLHPNSALWMDVINGHTGHPLHPAFGYMYLGHLNGFPYNIVGNSTPLVIVTFAPGAYASESDPLPAAGLPMPADVTAEGDPPPVDMTLDRHLILVDTDKKVLHELFQVARQADGSWTCMGYSKWDLTSNALRPDTWTSADAAGLPIFPLLIRWDEIQSGEIKHALRFTLSLTWKPHIWPARHDAVSGSANNPPMGMRVRLKANFDISSYSPTNQIILRALKKYGMFMADNGNDWDICGAPNSNFDDTDLHYLTQIIPTNAFEVVDTSAWMVDPNSAQSNVVSGTSASSTALQPLVPRIYPNPWRSDKYTGTPITIDHITTDSTVKIFTVSGHWVKTLTNNNGIATWDLTTDSGANAASGLYFFTVKTSDNRLARGKFAIIR
jgi:hypothetical protein